jgi:N6-L-threonylcarbamoyladenine synthase
MITLGIETSCDETALCILETQQESGDGNSVIEYRILGNIVHSQINLHREYGGVFPMLAKREHIKNLPILYEKIINECANHLKISFETFEKKIDNISVTQGPGLEPALWTGILFAQELHKKLNIPVIPTNHMEGHIFSTLISHSNTNNEFTKLKIIDIPALAVLISGGHTEIVKINKINEYKILGSTVDDAIGEAFDKVARMLELPYPGGPEISKLAEEARRDNIPNLIKLPRPMIHSKDLNFSFSGLKTAVLYTLKEIGIPSEIQKQDISREFENAVTDVLISKTKKAIEDNETKTLIVGGGVIANTHIKKEFEKLAEEYKIKFYSPITGLSGDNALMIALVGAIKPSVSSEGFKANGNLSF